MWDTQEPMPLHRVGPEPQQDLLGVCLVQQAYHDYINCADKCVYTFVTFVCNLSTHLPAT